MHSRDWHSAQAAGLTSELFASLEVCWFARRAISPIGSRALYAPPRVGYNGRNGVTGFIAHNWVDVVQTGGIIAGFLLSVFTIRREAAVRHVQNLFTLTRNHREIWTSLLERPELSRVLKANVDLAANPVSESERLVVLFLILHLASSFEAQKRGLYLSERGLRDDISQFFGLPIPAAVWMESKSLQECDFVEFVESCSK